MCWACSNTRYKKCKPIEKAESMLDAVDLEDAELVERLYNLYHGTWEDDSLPEQVSVPCPPCPSALRACQQPCWH
jgi:hypothetical protein